MDVEVTTVQESSSTIGGEEDRLRNKASCSWDMVERSTRAHRESTEKRKRIHGLMGRDMVVSIKLFHLKPPMSFFFSDSESEQ